MYARGYFSSCLMLEVYSRTVIVGVGKCGRMYEGVAKWENVQGSGKCGRF